MQTGPRADRVNGEDPAQTRDAAHTDRAGDRGQIRPAPVLERPVHCNALPIALLDEGITVDQQNPATANATPTATATGTAAANAPSAERRLRTAMSTASTGNPLRPNRNSGRSPSPAA